MAFFKASSIQVPDILFQTIKTGSPEIDMAFSELGGIVPSQVVMITGKPGSGKTTLSLCVTSKTTLATGKAAAFISLEMSDFQLALSRKKFPGFDTMLISTEFSLKETLKELREMKPSAIVLDSMQKAAGLMVKQKESPNFNQAQKDLVDAFYKFAKETFIPVFLIGHCSKGGSYLGPSHLEHEVDAHMKVEYDEELFMRTFSFGKNRFGGDGQPQQFGITSTGVWLGNPYVTDTEMPEDDDQAPEDNDGDDTSHVKAFNTIYRQFKANNGPLKGITMTEARAFSQATLNFLKKHDAHNIKTKAFVRDPSKIKLSFDYSGVAQCASAKGIIRIGKKMVGAGFQIGSIGYRKEQDFIKRNCTTKEELFLWVMCHEWVHLYKGMQHHKNEFFRAVEHLYLSVVRALAGAK
jgi:energy-coupling factor transporter ATP-binding protein EcfA2